MSAVFDILKKVTDGLEFLNETQAPDTETYRHYKTLVKEAREQIDIVSDERLDKFMKSPSGNYAALREAAEKLVKYLPRFIEAIDYYGIDGYYREAYYEDIKELRGRMRFLEDALDTEKGGTK